MCDKSASLAGDNMRQRCGVLACLLVVGCGDARPHTPDAQALGDTLRARIEAAYDFSRPGVAERMASLYPASGSVVSASGGVMSTSPDSLRHAIADFWQNVGQNMRDPVWQWREVHVEPLGPHAAVLTGTWSIPHIAPTGRPHVLEGAWTAVFRRFEGEWLIVHEHLSVPPQ
jgi:ketosteroid isomerase-like protein